MKDIRANIDGGIHTHGDICAVICEDIRADSSGDICVRHWLFSLRLVVMKYKSTEVRSHYYILYYQQIDVQIFIYKQSLISKLLEIKIL